MKVIIRDSDYKYGENVRLIRTLMKRESQEEYPEEFKWAVQMLYYNGRRWIEICRIDNYPHSNQQGSHIHMHGRSDVKRIGLTYLEAIECIKEISANTLRERYMVSIDFREGLL